MAVAQGYNITSAPNNLMFAYDTGDTVNCYLGKSTTNFYTNGDFTGGNGIPQEGGSNPTNTIVYLPNNPGGSDYVLRQNGYFTEYQINLTTQLISNTTYTLSGWYANTPDYNGAETMFHCRAFSATGNHVALDVGLYNVVETRVIDGITWKHCYANITTPSDYNGDFNWYVGYGTNNTTGYRYYTDLQMELGSYPSQFVDGSRSITGSLFNLPNRNGINVGSVSYTTTPFYPQIDFDGTDDVISIGNLGTIGTKYTIECIFNSSQVVNYRNLWDMNYSTYSPNTGNVGPRMEQYSDSTFTFIWSGNTSNNNIYNYTTPISISSNTNYHCAFVLDSGTVNVYLNGVLRETVSSPNGYITTFGDVNLGRGFILDPSRYYDGSLPIMKIYNTALTTGEVLNNYNNYKTRFNLS